MSPEVWSVVYVGGDDQAEACRYLESILESGKNPLGSGDGGYCASKEA